jgi:hypothetical protein
MVSFRLPGDSTGCKRRLPVPIVIPNNYFQVSIHGACGDASGEVVNVFGVHNSLSQPAQDVADFIAGEWIDDFGDFFSDQYALDRVHVAEAVPGETADHFGSGGGTVSGEACPMNVAALATKSSGISGRKNRGRMYFGCVPDVYTDGSSLTGPGVTQLQAGCDAFLENLALNGTEMVILHNGPGAPTTVAAMTVQLRLATQRGRLRD